MASVRGALEAAAAAHGEARRAAGAPSHRPLLVTKTRLTRLVCDGLQRDPVPYEHAWANVRGTLTHATIEAWLEAPDVSVASTGLAERVWVRLASERPGDPASLSAWLNARDAEERGTLTAEVAALADAFREVWPPLDDRVVLSTERRLVVDLGAGAVRLQGVPDLIVASPRRDGRARALVVDLKTGMPRAQQDRDELRFYALLVALHAGVPPFRWATLYVTEGRYEVEELTTDLLEVAARRVVDAIAQATRLLTAPGPDAATPGDAAGATASSSTVPAAAHGPERLLAGRWCGDCRRQDRCPVRAAAVSQASDMLP